MIIVVNSKYSDTSIKRTLFIKSATWSVGQNVITTKDDYVKIWSFDNTGSDNYDVTGGNVMDGYLYSDLAGWSGSFECEMGLFRTIFAQIRNNSV